MKDDEPSATALLIARSQVLLAESGMGWALGEGSARERYYRAFASEAAGRPWTPGPFERRRLWLIERISIPGMYLHYALRKLCIERLVREFLSEAGPPRQIVVIAGGFDPLLAMLADEQVDAALFELDHPATQAVKRSALGKMFADASRISLVPVDLTRQSVADALAKTDFSPQHPTLFIAEGITMYLTAAQISGFFRSVQSCARHPKSRFLFTYMNKSPSGSVQFESATVLADLWLRLKNEVFKWGIATSDLPSFLTALDCRMISVFDSDDLVLAHPKAAAHRFARGESICVAALTPD